MLQGNPIIAYAAGCRGNASNCLYPKRIEIGSEAAAKEAFAFDCVFAQYKGNYRSITNYQWSNAQAFDCDNDHSDNLDDWITADDIDFFYAGVPHIIQYSRHHMKWKDDKSPRPRFHVIFLIAPITKEDEYTAMKERVLKIYPFFDPNAKDSAHFFFGTENPEVRVVDGDMSLNAFLDDYEGVQAFSEMETVIPEGKRNSTLSHIGAKIIKRYGDTDEAYKLFLAEAAKCQPPLESDELERIWQGKQRFYAKIKSVAGYISPEAYNGAKPIVWETPIPFDEYVLPAFPVESLPTPIREYVISVAEATQTAVDMASSAAIGTVALCVQGKYRIVGKEDWLEPLNLFIVFILPPAERKSAVIALIIFPVEDFEKEVNASLDAQIIESQMKKSVLERERHQLEDKAAKGKATAEDIAQKAAEISKFKDVRPLKLFVDDVTAEKLASVLAENHSRAAIVSTEGGIFDILSGMYSKNVNIDVFLKGHSGDTIRVDRIGRSSESILHPALTMLLAVQPEVLSGLMSNSTFRGRGLTARFLYSMPKSSLGTRSFQTKPIPESVKNAYAALISLMVDTFGTGSIADEQLAELLLAEIDLIPSAIIQTLALHDLVLEHLRQTLLFARADESEFVRMLGTQAVSEQKKELSAKRRELAKAQLRIQELDRLFQRIYEDNVNEKLSDERFAKLSDTYTTEQKELETRITALSEELSRQEHQVVNVEGFLKLVRKYTEIPDLYATIIGFWFTRRKRSMESGYRRLPSSITLLVRSLNRRNPLWLKPQRIQGNVLLSYDFRLSLDFFDRLTPGILKPGVFYLLLYGSQKSGQRSLLLGSQLPHL